MNKCIVIILQYLPTGHHTTTNLSTTRTVYYTTSSNLHSKKCSVAMSLIAGESNNA